MTKYARRWSAVAVATTMLGATALSGPAFAQTTTTTFGGGGFRNPSPSPSPSPPPQFQQQSIDPGPRGGAPGAGGAIPGLSADEQNFFTAAKAVFNEVDGVPEGLGPRFNLDGCGGCHAFPAAGGSSPPTNPQVAVATAMGAKNTVPSFIRATGPVREVRFVNNPNGTPDGGVHDLFVITGRADAAGCNIAQPNFAAAVAANNAIFRIPTPTFGLGYIEAVPDASLQAAFSAAAQQKGSLGISGTFNHSGNDGTITRFGWKAQNKSLWIFAAEAYNVEQGVTNLGFPNEREDNPGCQFNNLPESRTNFTDQSKGVSLASGISDDVTNFAAFMRMLDPPTPAGSSAPAAPTSSSTSSASTSSTATVSRGQQVFSNIGCNACHITNQTTGGKAAITGVSN